MSTGPRPCRRRGCGTCDCQTGSCRRRRRWWLALRLPVFSAAIAMNGLKVEPGGVGAAQRAVQQRLLDALVQFTPAFDVDAVDKQVGVEGGFADEGQHLAVARVDGHQRSAPVAEHLLDQGLQPMSIDSTSLLPGWPPGCRAAHRAAAGTGLHLLEARGAVQRVLVALLQAELADVLGALVVGLLLVGPLLDRLLLGLVDAADVAEQVAAGLAERVAAKQPRLHVHALESGSAGP
jgi:hypothetical protein